MNAFTFTFSDLRDSIVGVAAVLVALGAIGRYVVLPAVRFFQRVAHVMESVEEQLYPNHGTSLRDAVTAIQQHLGIETVLPAHNPPNDRREQNHP